MVQCSRLLAGKHSGKPASCSLRTTCQTSMSPASSREMPRIARSNTQRWACKICSLRGMCFDDFLYLLELYSPYMLLRPTTNAPKPNTRFLKNVIRETDSHNAALRAKETEESKVRLRKLKARSLHNGERGTRGELSPDEHRSGTTGGERKRRRIDDLGLDGDRRRDRHTESDPRRSSNRKEETDSNDHRRNLRWESGAVDPDDDDEGSQRRLSRHLHKRHRRRYRSRSQDSSLRVESKSHKRRLSRLRSPDHSQQRSHRRSRRKRRASSASSSASRPQSKCRRSERSSAARSSCAKTSRQRSVSPKSDSDPLEAIIGPPPPPPEPKVRSRGRGTFASTSAMDTHFSSNYDPSADVHPNSDSENDWDQALEALRDRQRWKQQGAERLRSAGFTEIEVQKWEKGGEKREVDVKWAKKGEGREWDRGKVVDDEGDIDVKPEWGRLKGT